MITPGVKDVSIAAEFYEKGLGFPRLDFESDSVAFFTLNGSWLGLYGREALAEDAQIAAEGRDFNGFSLAHNVHSECRSRCRDGKVYCIGRAHGKAAANCILGRLQRLFSGSGWTPVGNCLQPNYVGRARRQLIIHFVHLWQPVGLKSIHASDRLLGIKIVSIQISGPQKTNCCALSHI